MAKSQIIKLTGTAYWPKVFEDTRDMYEYDEETGNFDKPSSVNGMYQITVELDDDEFKKLRRTGSMAAKFAKESEAGLDMVRFKRKHEAKGAGGKLLEFASGPPKVVDATGAKWDVDTMGDITNDSRVEVTVCVYQTAYSPGTRLEGVKVLTLAPKEVEEV